MGTLMILLALLLIVGVPILLWKLWGLLKPSANALEKLVAMATIFACLTFIIVLNNHTTPYYKEVDPFSEPCYSPISYEHSWWLILLHLLAVFSMMVLYFKEYKIPPIQILICTVLLTIGVGLNFQFIYQISWHDTSRIHLWNQGDRAGVFLAMYPALLIMISIEIVVKMIRNKAQLNRGVEYSNKWLAAINNRLIEVNNLPLFAVLLTLPLFLVLMLALVLFGQDVDAFTKVYSETATWRFSEHIHPPTVDDRHGHYLCTVAALGAPSIVKPIAIGLRNHQPIVVNRQLQIANAFEFMIQERFPKAHRIIRSCYDKYGLNLSKRVNTERLSNLTYYLMKPLEWFFLLALYTFCLKPEKIIKMQYLPVAEDDRL
ncbi:MAG: DUF6688 family protein [Bacteroidota bacterium]